ncbi:MAG: PAS domain S-box protein [Bacteroidales bacterium]
MRFRTLFDTFPVGIVQADQHGNFIAINPFFAGCLNMAETDVYKENFFQLCHPEDYFIERKQLDRLLRKETGKVNFEIRLINNDGKTSVCKIVANAVWENNDTFSFFTFVVGKLADLSLP